MNSPKRLRVRYAWRCTDPELKSALKAINKKYYRWWTCRVLTMVTARGVKLGPLAVSISAHRSGWAIDLIWLNLYGVGLWYR